MSSAYLTALSEMQQPGCWYAQMRHLRKEIAEATSAGNQDRAQRRIALLKSVEEMYEQRFGEPPDKERYA